MKFFVEKAFTLIEVLVAMLVLAIGMLGLAGITVVVLRSNVLSQQVTEATSIATDLVNRLRRVDYDGLSVQEEGGCQPVDTDSACAEQLEMAGIFDLDELWWPTLTASDSCATEGILSSDDADFDVVFSDLTEAGLSAPPNSICDVMADDDFSSEHYLRFYRVVNEGAGMRRRLVVGVLFRDRFQRWRMVQLDTLRFNR